MKCLQPLLFLAILALYWTSCGSAIQDNGQRPEAGIALDSLVRRVAIPSRAMNKIFNAVVLLPDSYFLDSVQQFYPVVYLLHGYSGRYDDWYERVDDLPTLLNEQQLIVVTPDGATNSWYLDSPQDSSSRFFTYISQEVPSYIDAHFRTYQDARFRGITGLSMGGHGALSIALQHPEWFGVAGSMSGVVDLRPYPNNWEIRNHLGTYAEDSTSWAKHSVVEMVDQPNLPQLIIDCGTEDFLIDENRDLHQRLIDRKIPHTYIERPGSHDWLYWGEAIEYQLQFFGDRFREG
ncbi:MAG: alpha/beta hydrolase family protein [Bacteroidota bacterium]